MLRLYTLFICNLFQTFFRLFDASTQAKFDAQIYRLTQYLIIVAIWKAFRIAYFRSPVSIIVRYTMVLLVYRIRNDTLFSTKLYRGIMVRAIALYQTGDTP